MFAHEKIIACIAGNTLSFVHAEMIHPQKKYDGCGKYNYTKKSKITVSHTFPLIYAEMHLCPVFSWLLFLQAIIMILDGEFNREINL